MKTGHTRLVLGLITVFLLVSSACQIPLLNREAQSTQAPVVESQIEIAPASAEQAAEDLPPQITETDPLPGSVVETRQKFTVIFNQAMDQASVESGFSMDPAISVTTEWADERTLEISPNEALPLDSQVKLSFSKIVKSATGLPVDDEQVLEFQTPGPLRLIDAFPEPDQTAVNPRGTLMVTFNQPVVALGESSDAAPAAFQLIPTVEGSGEWLNSSTYVFTPRPGLGGGVDYTLKLNQNLTSRQGAGLALDETQKSEWSFITALPHILSVEPDPNLGLAIDAAFTVTFSQPMDEASVEEHFSILDEAMQPVEGKVDWSEDSSILTFTPANLLERGSNYQFTLSAGASSLGGTQMGEVYHLYRTIDHLTVIEVTPSLTEPLMIYNGYSSIQVRFNAPLADTDFTKLVTFEPKVLDQYAYKSENNTVMFGGYFQGSQTYRMNISGELTDRWGQALGNDVTFAFTTGQISPQLTIPLLTYGFQTLFVTPQDASLASQVVNLPAVSISAETATLDRFLEAATDPNGFGDLSFSGKADSWQQALQGEDNSLHDEEIFLTENGDSLEPGLYLYQVTAAELQYAPWPFFLVVSDFNILLKRGDGQMLAWVVNLQSGQPAAGYSLDVYTTGAESIGSCTTDTDGRCEFTFPQTLDLMKPLVVVHGQPGDPDFAAASDSWRLGVSGSNFGLYSYGGNGLTAYLYTDRPIYRPGQTVYFRVIARQKNNARYTVPDLGEVHVEVYGKMIEETGEVPVIETITVPLSNYGTGWSSFVIPEDSGAGYYSMRITELIDSYLGFQVADYRKPEIDLELEFARPEINQGEDLRADLSATYYFGSPAANVPVHWTLYSAIDSFDLPYNYQTGNQASMWQMDYWRYSENAGFGLYITEGSGQTGPDGSLKIDIPYDQIADQVGGSDLQRLTIEATITDGSALPVSTRGSMLMHPEEYYIGVRPEQWTGRAGEPLGFAIQTADQQKEPVGGIELAAVLKRIHWTTKINEVSGYTESVPDYITESSVSLVTNENGQSRIEMTPEEPGTYILEVTGGNASTQVAVWVGGSGSVSWPSLNNEQLSVQMDQDEYQVGDTAHLFIPNPFEQALALITVERADISQSAVLPINSSQLDYELNIEPEYAPNVYVSVTLLNVVGNGVREFRQGYVMVPVNPRELTLQVKLQADPPAAEPGESVVLSLTALDAEGNPVQGEFSISLVDKAVLALAEPNAYDILKTFYTIQPLNVNSGMSLSVYAARENPLAAGGRGGGGGSMESLFVREDFKDTAYWNGNVVTDENGQAEVVVPLPDNVTTWVALARGLTQDTLVGETEIEVVVSRPLMVDPLTPRFAVAGDHMQMAAMLYNHTAADLTVDVKLQATGFTLGTGSAETQTVDIPAGGSQRVNWWGTVQSTDVIDVTVFASAGEFEDAATPEDGAIPVLHYSSPQTFATSGVLMEEGEILETVSLPHTWQPTGGKLTVEVAPSLAASILTDLEALKDFDLPFTETIISRMLPNLEMLAAVRTFELDDANLTDELSAEIQNGLDDLKNLQNSDGGWGWTKGFESETYLSSYVLMGLTRAAEEGFTVDTEMISRTQTFLTGALESPYPDMKAEKLDEQVYINYSLVASGAPGINGTLFMEYRDRLNPWAKAMLALTLADQMPESSEIANLISEVESLAQQTATGVHWAENSQDYRIMGSTLFSSSVVIYSLAKLNPASSLLPGAVRYLTAHRKAGGGWSTSYESAWSLRALIEVMKGTGEMRSNFEYAATLNQNEVISGQAQGLEQRTTVTGVIPLADLLQDAPNALRIRRGGGDGRLYYRAYLQLDRPVEEIQPLEKGLSIQRSYSLWGESCSVESCTFINEYNLSDQDAPVLAHITVTVPEEMYYVVVEDWLPAGAEIVDPSLLVSQQAVGLSEDVIMGSINPETNQWSNWYFGQPEIRADHVLWVASYLPAGTYELTYKFIPYLAGEFRTLPARTWQYYFPEVEGASAGTIFTIGE